MNEIEGRRPLKTRDWRIFQQVAAWLAQTAVTPNMISVSSIGFAVAAGLALAGTSVAQSSGMLAGLYFSAAVCMQLRLVANLLDGMVAVEGGKGSPAGALYNEVPDRVSDAAILIGAGYSLASRPELGLMAAVVAVFVAYVRAIGSSVGAGEVFAGPMAKPQRMALMTLGSVLCCFVSLSGSGLSGRWQSHIMGTVLGLIIVGGAITAVRRLRFISETLHIALRSDSAAGSETSAVEDSEGE
ncbi:CDP-alcohol phosphatidyltransferase [Stieleria maiorica]|uniref:CDP-alcohol phosphatidyltransferase n=1 Tax=Stieleria maiorica TaxID=2795974 RepID=A0A5B9MGL7_9BACT|nr:CDP-alcohol phosphatidyltransferase family protein [Stieleria maiorica]QEG00423.1 CDP-alcohol phosphatidyltransferase [Stieleria maiorica]